MFSHFVVGADGRTDAQARIFNRLKCRRRHCHCCRRFASYLSDAQNSPFPLENRGAMQMSACLSSYFKILSRCCPRSSSAFARRRRSTDSYTIHTTFCCCSHSLIPIEPFFFAFCLLSSFFSFAVARSLACVCECRYTVVVCFHLVIYNFVNLMLSRLRVPCSHSTTHETTQTHNRSERPTMHCRCRVIDPAFRRHSCDTNTHTTTTTSYDRKKETKNKRKKNEMLAYERHENNLWMCALNTFANISLHIILVEMVATPNGCYNLKRNDYNSESKTEKAWISRSRFSFRSLFFSFSSSVLRLLLTRCGSEKGMK